MTTDDHIVFIVDDDARIRESLTELLEAHGIRSIAYGSAGEYVRAENGMPAVDGFELHGLVKSMRPDLPVFFITGRDVMGETSNVRSYGRQRLLPQAL
jgi:FixJ family two-component response regulator